MEQQQAAQQRELNTMPGRTTTMTRQPLPTSSAKHAHLLAGGAPPAPAVRPEIPPRPPPAAALGPPVQPLNRHAAPAAPHWPRPLPGWCAAEGPALLRLLRYPGCLPPRPPPHQNRSGLVPVQAAPRALARRIQSRLPHAPGGKKHTRKNQRQPTLGPAIRTNGRQRKHKLQPPPSPAGIP